MIFIKGNKLNNEQINSLYNLHRKTYGYTGLLNEFKKILPNIYILTDNDSIRGYIYITFPSSNIVKVEWIYGPGYGKLIMLNIEYHFKKKGYRKIILNISINPIENKKTILRGLNFYIKNKYLVYDIEFISGNGLILKMEKKLL